LSSAGAGFGFGGGGGGGGATGFGATTVGGGGAGAEDTAGAGADTETEGAGGWTDALGITLGSTLAVTLADTLGSGARIGALVGAHSTCGVDATGAIGGAFIELRVSAHAAKPTAITKPAKIAARGIAVCFGSGRATDTSSFVCGSASSFAGSRSARAATSRRRLGGVAFGVLTGAAAWGRLLTTALGAAPPEITRSFASFPRFRLPFAMIDRDPTTPRSRRD